MADAQSADNAQTVTEKAEDALGKTVEAYEKLALHATNSNFERADASDMEAQRLAKEAAAERKRIRLEVRGMKINLCCGK